MNDSPELAITNDPPRAQYRHCVRWPGIALEGRWFLNHRGYRNGKLGPGEVFRGHFLAKGGSPAPEDLRKSEAIEVRFIVEDTKGNQYRSDPMSLFFHW